MQKALAAISTVEIEKDFSANREVLPIQNYLEETSVDYTFCAKSSSFCTRFVAQTLKAEAGSAILYTIVNSYQASDDYQKPGTVLISKESAIQEDKIELNQYNFRIVKMALDSLANDFEGNCPTNHHNAVHPFNISIAQVGNRSEIDRKDPEEQKWVYRYNNLVTFHQNFVSRYAACSEYYSYLVRTFADDDKIIKSDVKRLNLDDAIK